MSYDSIQQNHLVTLDAEGAALYKNMRDAEEDWIKNTGFKHFDLERRTHILIAHKPTLPSIKSLEQTRRDFKHYLEQNNEDPGINIGIRSTAMPVWISQGKKIPIDQHLEKSQLVAVESIVVRKQIAWRGALLNQQEAQELIEKWIQKSQYVLQKAIESRQYKRVEQIQARILSLQETQKIAEKLFQQYGTLLSARILSGHQTKFLIKDSNGLSCTTSVANIAILLGHKNTRFETENPLKRVANAKHDILYNDGKIAFVRNLNA